MKTTILTIILLASVSLFSQNKKQATTNIVIQGVYIFIESEPLKEYKVIDNMKFKVDFSSPQKDFEKAVKVAKRKHPNIEALIFRLTTKHRADLIKFI